MLKVKSQRQLRLPNGLFHHTPQIITTSLYTVSSLIILMSTSNCLLSLCTLGIIMNLRGTVINKDEKFLYCRNKVSPLEIKAALLALCPSILITLVSVSLYTVSKIWVPYISKCQQYAKSSPLHHICDRNERWQ